MLSRNLGLLFSGLMGHLFLKNIDGFINTSLCFNKFQVDQFFDKGVVIVFVVYRRITNRVFTVVYLVAHQHPTFWAMFGPPSRSNSRN